MLERHTLGYFYQMLNGRDQKLAARLRPFVLAQGGSDSGSKYGQLFSMAQTTGLPSSSTWIRQELSGLM